MDPPPPLLLLLTFLTLLVSSSTAASSLDPKQLTALQSMGISTAVDPCSPRRSNSSACDSSSPFRHLVSLSLTDCSSSLSFPSSALLSLSSLVSLSLLRCPSPSLLRRPLPSPLASNLRSFSSVSSSPEISGVWLSRLSNLTSLLVLGTPIRASAPFVFFSQMPRLADATVSGCNLSGGIPHHWNSPNLTHLDLSSNRLRGPVPNLIGSLRSLRKLNLSSNELNGTLPATVGDLVGLREMSLSGNSISGPVPASMRSMAALTHLDLSSNSFNGSLPSFFQRMKGLRFLSLENNNFQGVLPFDASFIKRLDVFRVGGNGNLCYNHSLLSSKLKLGIAPCDKYGLPASPLPDKSDSSSSSKSDTSDYDDEGGGGGGGRRKSGGGGHHGPSTLVLVVAIGLSCLGFLVVFAICISKCRKCCS